MNLVSLTWTTFHLEVLVKMHSQKEAEQEKEHHPIAHTKILEQRFTIRSMLHF